MKAALSSTIRRELLVKCWRRGRRVAHDGGERYAPAQRLAGGTWCHSRRSRWAAAETYEAANDW